MKISDKHSQAARENLKKALEARKKNLIPIVCPQCKKEYIQFKSYIKRGQICCSWECRQLYRVGERGINFGPNERMRGKRNPNYKDGTGYERQERYHAEEVNRWRRLVYRRDKFTCQKCGLRPKAKGMLRAHHIIPWKDSVELRFEVSNGITLCADCHLKIHKGA